MPAWPDIYAHVKEHQETWLADSSPLPEKCALHPRIRRMLLGLTSPAFAPRIGAAQDVEERMLKWSEGMEPRFIGWNALALHTFDFTFSDIWSRKKQSYTIEEARGVCRSLERCVYTNRR